MISWIIRPRVMHPVIAHLGPVTIYSFGLMMAVAFLVGGFVVGKELERHGLDPGLGSAIVFWAAVGGLVGARLWVIVEDLDAFVDAPLDFLLSGAGFVWYGGLLGGLAAVSIVFRRHRVPWLTASDCVAAALPLGHAIGRIGCQLAGDGDWGKETTLPWGMAYPHAIIGWNYPAGVRVHPTPLYEAALYTGIFVLLWSRRRGMKRPGTVLALYFMLAGAARFLVEFVRIEPQVLLGLTSAQLFSIAVAAVGLVLLLRGRALAAS